MRLVRSWFVFGVECCVKLLGLSVRLCGGAEVADLVKCCFLVLLLLVVVVAFRCAWVLGMLAARWSMSPTAVSRAAPVGAALTPTSN